MTASPIARPCRACGHPRDMHTHHRVGADCGRCGPDRCPRYRRPTLIDLIKEICS